jgi:hypothetical protein
MHVGPETVKKRTRWLARCEQRREARNRRLARIEAQFASAHLRGTFPEPAPRERVRERHRLRDRLRRRPGVRVRFPGRFRLAWRGPGWRPAEPDWLRLVGDCLQEVVRLGEWFAADLPEIFGPDAARLQAEAAAQARLECEAAAALDKVYGPPPPGAPPRPRPDKWSVLFRHHDLFRGDP